MEIQNPPEESSGPLTEYLFRQFKIVENELNSGNGISIKKELPDRPRNGKLYFVDGSLFFWADDAWQTIAVTSDIPEIPEIPEILDRKWSDV